MLPFEGQVSLYLYLQLALDFLLLGLLFLLWIRFRRLEALSPDDLAKRLDRLEDLARNLDRYLQEEKGLVERLRMALEAGARAWEESEKGRGDLRKQVLRLSQEGLSSEEIARRLSLSPGEVELLISLERFKKGAA